MAYNEQDQEMLDRTQQIRSNIMKKFADEGIPNDPELVNILLKAAKDADTQVITRKKVEVDEASGNNIAEIKSMVAETIIAHNANKARIARERAKLKQSAPVLEGYQRDNVVQGDSVQGVVKEDYESFTDRMTK